MLLLFYISIFSAIARAGCEDLTGTFCALSEEITSNDDRTLFFENDVVGFKTFTTFLDEEEFRDFFNKLSPDQKLWLAARGPTEIYGNRSIEREEGHRLIFAGLESPFCAPRKDLGEQENCQTDLHDPAYKLYEPLSPQIDTGCGHGLKCMKTSADQSGGICVKNEHPKVGCGQFCDDDEYCSVADGSDVSSNYFDPSSPEQLAWSHDTVTAVCPFHANLDDLLPTLEALSLRNPIQRYNTPFCTCRKRLKHGSSCQLNHYKSNLDVLFIPRSSHNLIADSEDEYRFNHRNVEHIDVGCSRDRICMAREKANSFFDYPYDSVGKCVKKGEKFLNYKN